LLVLAEVVCVAAKLLKFSNPAVMVTGIIHCPGVNDRSLVATKPSVPINSKAHELVTTASFIEVAHW
jgi:hypothetical protein